MDQETKTSSENKNKIYPTGNKLPMLQHAAIYYTIILGKEKHYDFLMYRRDIYKVQRAFRDYLSHWYMHTNEH